MTDIQPIPFEQFYPTSHAVRDRGRELPEPFDTRTVMQVFGGIEKMDATNMLSSWLRMEWAVRTSRGWYRRGPRYGASARTYSCRPSSSAKFVNDPANQPKVDFQNNEATLPDSLAGIALLTSLIEPFTRLDVAARLDGDRNQRAEQWLAAWHRHGWIERAGFGSYRRKVGI